MRLLIVRHGESYANAEGLIQGQGESPKFDLSARGRAQARACGERLDREGLKPTHVYASPLSRTAETARLIVERWGMDIEYWDDLMEHDMGSASGLTLDRALRPPPRLGHSPRGDTGILGPPRRRVPGGPRRARQQGNTRGPAATRAGRHGPPRLPRRDHAAHHQGAPGKRQDLVHRH